MAKAAHGYIEMKQRRFNYFPHAFQWQGRTFQVRQVERTWPTMAGWFSRRRASRLNFRVRTVALPAAGCPRQQAGRLDIYQDLQANTWHVSRVLA